MSSIRSGPSKRSGASGRSDASPGTRAPNPWYPLAFARDLTSPPHRVTVNGRGLALFHADGAWQAVRDRCPHRAARLSDGAMRDGHLECRYHGWQFGAGGKCRHIPQLLDGRKMPAKAHVDAFPVKEAQGIVWLRTGAGGPLDERADETAPPAIEALELFECTTIDFMIDLPYERSFLVENVIDIAHIHVAHHGVRGGGHREMAAPLDFEVSERTATGFAASFRSIGLDTDSALRGARVSFVAPNLVHYESLYEDAELCSGLALYSLPLGPDRCRLLYRAYNNFPRLRDRLRPRWVEHWTQCTILEQDMDVVQGQVEEIVGSGKPPRDLWLPLKSSDALVIAYRRWLDEHASWADDTTEQSADGPAAASAGVGFDRLNKSRQAREEPPAFDRLAMHTRLCSSCSRAHARLLAIRTPLVVAAFLLLALAVAAGGGLLSHLALGLALLAGAGRLVVDRLERRFRGRG